MWNAAFGNIEETQEKLPNQSQASGRVSLDEGKSKCGIGVG